MHMQIYCLVLEFAFLVLEPVYGRRFDSKPIDRWCTKDKNPGAHRELLKILVDHLLFSNKAVQCRILQRVVMGFVS